MSYSRPIFRNGEEIGVSEDNKTYIYLSTIASKGKYESGKYYIKSRCKKLNIKLYFSDCVDINDLKNIFIPNTNGIHKRHLLLFVNKI